MTTESEENQGDEMETTASKGSLSEISAARVHKSPGSSALGVGLEARGVHVWREACSGKCFT
jgi:hypothetical protein